VNRLIFALAALATALVVAVPAGAATTYGYEATFVEPFGGCAPGTSCGTASISGLGHSDNQVVVFVIRIEDQPSGFAFYSPGNSGSHGMLCFPGLPGDPQFLEINETIVGGTGALAGATGSGSGEVKRHGCIAVGKTSGTITLP
jgi:hypothetical protein